MPRTESFYRHAGEIAQDLDTPIISSLPAAPPVCGREEALQLESFATREDLAAVTRMFRSGIKSLHVAGISGDIARDAILLSLARVLAETGRRILVIDADADGPPLAGAGNEGVTDAMTERAAAADVIQLSPGYEGMMAFLPVGSSPESLESPGAADSLGVVLSEMRPSYDVVLMSAPCLDRRGKVHPASVACEAVLLVLSPAFVSRDRIRRNFLQLWGVDASIRGILTLGIPDVVAEVLPRGEEDLEEPPLEAASPPQAAPRPKDEARSKAGPPGDAEAPPEAEMAEAEAPPEAEPLSEPEPPAETETPLAADAPPEVEAEAPPASITSREAGPPPARETSPESEQLFETELPVAGGTRPELETSDEPDEARGPSLTWADRPEFPDSEALSRIEAQAKAAARQPESPGISRRILERARSARREALIGVVGVLMIGGGALIWIWYSTGDPGIARNPASVTEGTGPAPISDEVVLTEGSLPSLGPASVPTPEEAAAPAVESTPLPEGARTPPPVQGGAAQAEAPPEGIATMVAEAGQVGAPFYGIHITSFRSEERARADALRLAQRTGHEAIVVPFDIAEAGQNKGRWYRVVIGHFESASEAQRVADSFREKGWTDYARVHRIVGP